MSIVPPYDPVAEDAALAAAIATVDGYNAISTIISAGDFYSRTHARVFEVCSHLEVSETEDFYEGPRARWCTDTGVNAIGTILGRACAAADASGVHWRWCARTVANLSTFNGSAPARRILEQSKRRALYMVAYETLRAVERGEPIPELGAELAAVVGL